MIPVTDIDAATHIIDTSGVVGLLGDAMRTDHRGRKDDPNKLRLLLIGMLLCIHEHGRATITVVHKLLTTELPVGVQFTLGVRRWKTDTDGQSIWILPIHDLYELSAKITNRLGYGDGKNPDLDPAERERRRRIILAYNDALMDAFDLGWTSSIFAMDATGIWSWGKGKKQRGASPSTTPSTGADPVGDTPDDGPTTAPNDTAEANGATPDVGDGTKTSEGDGPSDDEIVVGDPTSHDPDASWGVKTAKNGKEETFYGFHEHTLLQVPADGQKADDEPRLIRRFEVTAANVDVVAPSLDLIDRLNDRYADAGRQQVEQLIVDRHYHYKAVERWKDQLARRGIAQINDLRVDEHGFIEGPGRVRWAAGHAHCPATPDDLGTILRPGPGEPRSKFDAFAAQIQRRERYALARRSSPAVDGSHRAQCPALAGTVGCPLRPGTVEAAIELGLPLIEQAPDPRRDGEPLPACCTQQTVTLVPPPAARKLQQEHYWGSERWTRKWKRRTYVEGSYGNRKNTSTENMRRGQFRVTGIAWVNIVVGRAAASYNLRMLRNWQQRTGKLDPAHPLVAAPPPDHGFVMLTEEEYAQLAARYQTDAA